MSIYLENVTKGIRTQIVWSECNNSISRNEFLDKVIEFCQKEKEKPFKLPKSSKTRHGSGKRE